MGANTNILFQLLALFVQTSWVLLVCVKATMEWVCNAMDHRGWRQKYSHGVGHGKTVLVTTGRQTKSLHVVRALREVGARVIVADYQSISTSALSLACDKFIELPKLDAFKLDDWVEHLGSVVEEEKVDLVVPVSTINEVLFMAVARDRLANRFPKTIWLTSGLEMMMDLDDKVRFSQICEKYGVPTPEHGMVKDPEALQDPSIVPYNEMDIILKRLESSVNREEEIIAVPRGQRAPKKVKPSESDPWQWQRLIRGEEFSAWYICHGGKVTFSACYPSQPDLMHFDGFPVPSDVDEKLTAFITAANLTGQYAFDFFREKKTGSFYVIECNPRASSILETVSGTPQWGEALFGVDVRHRTRYSSVGFFFHRNCWPWTNRSEGIFSFSDPLPFFAGEILWPLQLIANNGTVFYHHIDVNIGKIITSGPSAPRQLSVFARLVTEARKQRLRHAVRYCDRLVVDADTGLLPEHLVSDERDVMIVRRRGATVSSKTTAKVVDYDNIASLEAILKEFGDGASSLRIVVGKELLKKLDLSVYTAERGENEAVLELCRTTARTKTLRQRLAVVPSRKMRVIHVVGSQSGTYYEGVSKIYGSQCMESVKNGDDRFEHHLAYVHIDGKWSFDSLEKDCEKVEFGVAMERIRMLNPDVMVPHMFDYLGMTAYRAVFDALGVEILGCTPEAMGLSTHKARAKAVTREGGVQVPASVTIKPGMKWVPGSVPLPVVVKPAEEDNSMGIEIVRDEENMEAALERAFEFGDEVLVEQYIPLGREIRVGIVEDYDGTMNMVELTEYIMDEVNNPIRRSEEKLSTDDKGVPTAFAPNGRQTPARNVSDELRQKLYESASKAHKAIGCRDYSLYDYRVDPNDEPYMLEASLYCSFAPMSALVLMAEASGIKHPRLFIKLAEQAVMRADKRRSSAEGSAQVLGMKKR
mmetsp:Transcript_8291/g.24893  ORF Transcript_8291/g.24893 Transcript_8291/m.24893 type:complete len:927 (-) Transcript_8291:2146-4926(-)